MSAGRTWYEILGVAETASMAEIKRAYRARVRRVHPDAKPGQSSSELAARTKATAELNRLAEALLDPSSRAEYDLDLAHLRRAGPSVSSSRPAPAEPAAKEQAEDVATPPPSPPPPPPPPPSDATATRSAAPRTPRPRRTFGFGARARQNPRLARWLNQPISRQLGAITGRLFAWLLYGRVGQWVAVAAGLKVYYWLNAQAGIGVGAIDGIGAFVAMTVAMAIYTRTRPWPWRDIGAIGRFILFRLDARVLAWGGESSRQHR